MNELILSVALAVAGSSGQTGPMRAGTGAIFAEPIDEHLMIADAKPVNPGDLRAESGAPPLMMAEGGGAVPAHWRSIISGAEWTIRRNDDVLYLERLLSDAALRDAHSTTLELHKGKKGYRGTERQVVGVAYTDQSGREVSYKCVFDWPAEVALLTESRIEIRVLSPPDNSTIDFRKCTVDKTRVWHTAVWIRE